MNPNPKYFIVLLLKTGWGFWVGTEFLSSSDSAGSRVVSGCAEVSTDVGVVSVFS